MPITGTAEITELVYSEVINDAILEYARSYTPSAPFMKWQDLRGKGSKVGSFARWVLDSTEDVGETTALTSVALETTQVSATAAEIGIYREVTYSAIEESIIGQNLFNFLVLDAAELSGLSLEDDIDALFPSLSTSVGTSGSGLSLANMVEALASLRSNQVRGMPVFILDDQQGLDYQAAQQSSTSTTTNQLMTMADSPMEGFLGMFWGAPVYVSSLCDTANTGANVVGACFVRGDTNPKSACYGAVLTRDITSKFDDDIQNRRYKFANTAKWGVAEINDPAGVKIVTDA